MDSHQFETDGSQFTDYNHNDGTSFCNPSTELCIACGEVAIKYNSAGNVIKRRQVNPEHTYQALFDIACKCFSSFRMNPSANQDWDFEKDPFPFCKVCENQIVVLADLYGHVSQLKYAFKQKAGRGQVHYDNLSLDGYSTRYNERYVAFRKMAAPPASRHIYANVGEDVPRRKKKAINIQASLQSLTISDTRHQPPPQVVTAPPQKSVRVPEKLQNLEEPVTNTSKNETGRKRKRLTKYEDLGPRLKVGLKPNFSKSVDLKVSQVHAMTKKGHFRQLRMFIENGGCVNATDAKGNTLLHSVLMAKTSQVSETVGFLLDALANPLAKNSDGMTPFEVLAVNITQQFRPGDGSLVSSCQQQAILAPDALDSETEIPQVTFDRITCDGCETCPINNIRCKCLLCFDFDLCNHCLQRGLHVGHVFAVARTKKQSDFLMKFHQKNFSRLYAGWSHFLRSFGQSNHSTDDGMEEVECTSCSTILEDEMAYMCLQCDDNLCNSCWKSSSSAHLMAVVFNAKQRDTFLKLFRYQQNTSQFASME